MKKTFENDKAKIKPNTINLPSKYFLRLPNWIEYVLKLDNALVRFIYYVVEILKKSLILPLK